MLEKAKSRLLAKKTKEMLIDRYEAETKLKKMGAKMLA